MIVVLAGGTGGAKLARGVLDVVGPDELAVIANTGDDIEVHGVHVSPDPDLVTYWLADLIDERGWGIAGDTWEATAAVDRAGGDAWFQLGDRDLAMCRLRTRLLQTGERLTVAHAEVVRAVGVSAQVLPMSDEPVRSRVLTSGRWMPFQEFMILARGARPEGVRLDGIEEARPTPDVFAVLERAAAIVIGPSNPVISIGPILAVPGMREAIVASAAPVVAVSPFVHGRALKGPTEAFCAMAGLELGAEGVLSAYDGLIDGVVADDASRGDERTGTRRPAALGIETLMDTSDRRRGLARAVLDFAGALCR